ncbi:PAS domain-containing protein [Stieleria varia]|nr:PAS domain-containing protein [Stieleria varia]
MSDSQPHADCPLAPLESVRQILDRVTEIVWSVAWNGDESKVFCNHRAQQVFRCDCDSKLMLQDLIQCIHSEDRAQFRRDLDKAKQSGSLRHKFRVTDNDGNTEWLDQRLTVVNDSQSQVVRIDAVAQVIAARELSPSPSQLTSDAEHQTLREHVELSVLRKDRNGRILYANDRFCELVGRSSFDLIGKTDFDLFPAELAKMYLANDQEVIRSGQPEHVVEQNIGHDGKVTYVEVLKLPTYDSKGDVVGIQVLFWDVSYQKAVESDLEQARFLMNTLLENVPDSVYFKNQKSQFIRISRSVAKALQLDDPADAIGKTDADFFLAERANRTLAEERAIMDTGEPIIAKLECETNADGEEVWRSTTKVPLRTSDGEILGTFGISRDVTRERRAENERNEERKLLRTIIDNIPSFIYVKDRHGRFVLGNQALMHMLGVDAEDALVSKNDYDFSPPELACEYVTDDQVVMRTGEPITNQEESCQLADGTRVWMSTTKVPLHDDSGQVRGIVGIGHDITNQKRVHEQLRAAKQAADAASKAKSDFLANMSHEIRTPMNAITGMTELLLDTRLTDTQREYLEMVRGSGDALLAIINDVLDFSKIEAGMLDIDTHPFELRELIGDTVKTLAVRAHEKHLELAFRVSPEIPQFVVGDAGRIRQVLVNLVGNAIKFTQKGEVVVEVTESRNTDQFNEICVCVRDTGMGIPEAKRESVFRAFEQSDSSTTRRFGGTGLGLAISTRLVEMMNGSIWVESQENVGSQFYFTVRLGFAPPEMLAEQRRGTVVLGGTRVLVVDDNKTNRTILHEILTSWGMNPTLADGTASAMQAIEIAREHGQPFGLIVSDVNMPEQDGFDFASLLRQEESYAKVPFIMLTSAGRAGDAERRSALDISERLMKPVKQSELFNSIVRVLGVSCAEDQHEKTSAADFGIRDLRILVAEDNIVNQKLAIGVLGENGHQVVIASNGQEAIDALQREPFDLVLMDVQMPVMDGLTATKAIREWEKPQGKHIPIIAMTANAMKGDREQCLAAGMDEYVPKPIRKATLFSCLAEVIKRQTQADSPTISLEQTLESTSQSETAVHDTMESPMVDEEDLGEDISGEIAESCADECPIHWDELSDMSSNNSDLLKQLLDAFVQESASLKAALQEGFQSDDANAIRAAAHTLKGASAAIAAPELSELCAELESQARASELENAPDLMKEIESELEKVLSAIADVR